MAQLQRSQDWRSWVEAWTGAAEMKRLDRLIGLRGTNRSTPWADMSYVSGEAVLFGSSTLVTQTDTHALV